MTAVWSPDGALLQSLVRDAHVAIGVVMLSFVLLEALYLAWLALYLTRWKAGGHPPDPVPSTAPRESLPSSAASNRRG